MILREMIGELELAGARWRLSGRAEVFPISQGGGGVGAGQYTVAWSARAAEAK